MEAKKHLHIPSINIPLWWPSGRGWRRLARWLLPSPGNVLFTLLVVGGLLWATSAGALPFRAPALAGDSTTTISYQGRLAYDNGDPVNSAGIGMQFCLYDTDVGGSPVDDWCETHLAVPVEDGLFHVRLGSVLPIPVSTLASHSNLWLGITVGSDDSEMEPREQIASVPYAMIASTMPDGSVTAGKIADGAVTSRKLKSTYAFKKLTDGEVVASVGTTETVLSLTLVTETESVIFAFSQANTSNDSGEYAVTFIEIDGEAGARNSHRGADRQSSENIHVKEVSPGEHTVRLRVEAVSGGPARAYNGECAMWATVVGR